jgi:hypothetical protein
MSRVGIGVMIQSLGGNAETVKAVKSAIGKQIVSVAVNGEALKFLFSDNTRLSVYDSGQSCCESRWMHTDDDLSHYVGATLEDMELAGGGEVPADSPARKPGEYHDVFESQFLKVKTSEGVFTVVNYVDHNGYYGGFYIVARSE